MIPQILYTLPLLRIRRILFVILLVVQAVLLAVDVDSLFGHPSTLFSSVVVLLSAKF